MPRLAQEMTLRTIGAQEFKLFRELIHKHTGIFLRDGKQVMLASRLSRRLRARKLSSFADYYQYLESCCDDGQELGELINCVTTNKTSFFRERHHFDFLSEQIPQIVRSGRPALGHSSQSSEKPCVRVWSAACSTGEEPYTIAITLLEAQRTLRMAIPGGWNMQIAASDIDTTVLEKARSGIYGAEALAEIDPALHKRYFLRGNGAMTGQIKVKNELSSLIEFHRINLMESQWPLGAAFDAIFFRNALIYFQQNTQDQILRRILRFLKPGGYLFLGHSENIPWLHNILEPLQHTIFRLRRAQP